MASPGSLRRTRITVVAVSTVAALAIASSPAMVPRAGGQEQGPTKHEFKVSGGNYAFEPAILQVRQDDLVKIVFHAVDMPHSFAIDAYRIAKRASAGESVTFDFRADQAGRFPFYCSLTVDDRCRQMRGELVVIPR